MKIVTHNGTPHRDDFLACCYLLAKHPDEENTIERKEKPSQEDLADSNVYVVDFGRKHEPEKLNFDHHQMSGGSVCAFTLLLEHFGERDYHALPWIATVETHDHNGPGAVKELLMSDLPTNHVTDLIQDPCLSALLFIFEAGDEVCPKSSFYKIMQSIGLKIQCDYSEYKVCYEDLVANFEELRVHDYILVDLRKINQSVFSHTAFNKFFSEHDFDMILNHNSRGGDSFRLKRLFDDIDFNKAKEYCGFVHQNGFLATFNDINDLGKIVEKL